MADNEDVIVLVDENGDEHEFYLIDMIEVDGKEYAILAPTGEEADEAIILRVEHEDDENDVLVDVDDDEEWERVANVWESYIEREMADFDDEDEEEDD